MNNDRKKREFAFGFHDAGGGWWHIYPWNPENKGTFYEITDSYPYMKARVLEMLLRDAGFDEFKYMYDQYKNADESD